MPIVWRVMRHGSSSVSFEVYQGMLKRAARLVPAEASVCFLADRGNASTTLMRYLRSGVTLTFSDSGGVSADARQAGGILPPRRFNLLVKSSSWIYRPNKGWFQLNQYHLALGEVVLLQGVTLTADTAAILKSWRNAAASPKLML